MLLLTGAAGEGRKEGEMYREGRRSDGERQTRSEWERCKGVEREVEGDTQRRGMRNGGGSHMN